jgi:hypothetical protein
VRVLLRLLTFGRESDDLARHAVVSGSVTTQPRRSSHPMHMALASRDTPVRRGRSLTRVPERTSTRKVLALMGRAIRAVDSTSTVKASSTPLRSGDSEAIGVDCPDGPSGAARRRDSSNLPPWVGWMTGR